MTYFRKIAFGYSTACNSKCRHCVAENGVFNTSKMAVKDATMLIDRLAAAQVRGISFTAGEPFLFIDDIASLVSRCYGHGIYSRIVTNGFWAKTPDTADAVLDKLKRTGLSQLRLSFSRYHQEFVSRQNIVNAARACRKTGIDYFVSFITDFSDTDEPLEIFLRDHGLIFFPEPLIYSGRAGTFKRRKLFTDYQDNCCGMNPYISPEFDMYACCDAGPGFTTTNFFYLGNLKRHTVEDLFRKKEENILYNHIKTKGITAIASFAGFKSKEIVTCRKCELCMKLFNSPETLLMLKKEAERALAEWKR